MIRKIDLESFKTSTLEFKNLQKLGFQAMEYMPHLNEEGLCLDQYYYRGCGRILEPTPLFIGNGYGLIELYIDPPQGYEFAEPVNVIASSSDGPILDFRKRPELFKSEEEEMEWEKTEGVDENDHVKSWDEYLTTKRLYNSLPDLKNQRMPINLPIGTINGTGVIEIDIVMFLKYKGSPENGDWENGPYKPILPFSTQPNLLPLNLQTSHTYLWGKKDLTPAIMMAEECEETFEMLKEKLKWNDQQSSSNPFKSQQYFEPNPNLIIIDPIHINLSVVIEDNLPLKTEVKLKSHPGPSAIFPHQFRRQMIPTQESFQKDNWKEGYFDIDEYLNT
jgi:hypothetical protein